MPDKDYIKKVYSFMEGAYGKNGKVRPGAFSGSFDNFYNSLSTNERYADKIFGALSLAYGPDGAYRRDAFTADRTSFRDRVLSPQKQGPTTPDGAASIAAPAPSDPAQAVLQTATEIEVPQAQAAGPLGDISAFQPQIQAQEQQRQADLRRAEGYLLPNAPGAPITMAPATTEAEKRQVIDRELQDANRQYEVSMRGTLQQLEQEDKNRLSSQQAADELYKTPQGRLYYDFVRPIYKTALETAGKTGAFGARLFNADKTADKIVEYFDFDRLAREGNTTARLNVEPTKQRGKLGINNILPRSVEALTNMSMLLGGSAALGSGKLGLLGTSFATQYEGYRQEAKAAGLSDVDADRYAMTGAGVTSVLELVSPNEMILNNAKRSLTKSTVLETIKNGGSVQGAVKSAIKSGLKESGKESVQELTQMIGDNTVRYAFDNYVLNDPLFKQEDILPSAREALETIVLTSIATGVVSTPGLISRNRVPVLERSSWAAAAQEPQMVEEGLSRAVSEGQITQEKADQIRKNVAEYKSIYDAISAKGYGPEATERMAINAYRANKIDEQNKPIAGIPVLSVITAEDEQAKGDIEREVLSAVAGQPETAYDVVEENISEPVKLEEDAIQEQTADESVLREERPEVGLQEVVERNSEPQVPPVESQQVEPEASETLAAPMREAAASMKPEEIKERRDKARDRLKSAWDSYKTTGIISDAERNMKRDKEFYSALTAYVKEELLYRVNQVKGFAEQRKARIKRAITTSLKEEGISIQDVSILNDAFEEAYAQTKSIPGVLPDEKNDRISFRQYIKDRIKVREAGMKKGLKVGTAEATSRVKVVRSAIQETLKGSGIKLTIRQLRTINAQLQRAANSHDINKAISRAVDAATNIMWQAQNKQKISRTNTLIRNIGKLKRSKSMVLQDVEWLKGLQLPSPSRVDDIDTYMDMLRDFVQSRRADELTQRYTKEEISDFVDQENDRIYREKRASMQDDLDDLKEQGLIDKDVTLDEYTALLDGQTPKKLSEGISKKQEILKRELKTKLGYVRDRLPEFEGEEKGLVTKLIQVDPSYLGGADLIRLNNVLNNIAEFGTLDSAGEIVTTYEAMKAVEELATSGDKIRQLPRASVLTRKNLSNIMSALFYNDSAISRFREKTIGPIERKLSPVYKRAQGVVKDFVALNRKHKIGSAANARLHVYSFINQYRGIENAEIADDLSMRVDELLDDASYFVDEANRVKASKSKPYIDNAKQRLDALQKLGLISSYRLEQSKEGKKDQYTLFADRGSAVDVDDPLKTIEHAWSQMSAGEKEVYNFVRTHYDALTDKLEFVTRSYAGKEFQRERNYVSLVAAKKSGEQFQDKEMSEDTDITYDLRSLNSKPAGTTKRRLDRKPKGVYYDGDFFSNFVNRYYQSLYTAEVLPELQTVAKTVNSHAFKEYITGQLDKGFAGNGAANYTAFKDKIAQVINEGKYSPFFRGEKQGVFDNAATRILSGGVRLALNNIWQGPAQLFPALMHNFAIADTKATAYAIGSAFKPLWSKQNAKERQDFLKHFTGVKRSALGSQAYDSYIGRLTDEPGWWLNARDFAEKIHKLSAYSLERADRAAQETAYISGYITSLLKQGKIKEVGDFDMAEHAANPDKEALAFAEQTASAINNESAREYKPDVLKDADSARYLWLLQGFSLNAYQNAMNKAKIIWDNRSTKQERNEAVLHFGGYMGEMATYQLIKGVARGFQAAIAGALVASLFGVDVEETEDEKKQKKIKEAIRSGANSLADITLSGLPAPVQAAAKATVNIGYKMWAAAEAREKRKRAKEKGEKFDARGTYISPYFVPFYGVEGPGGGAEFYSAAGEKAVKAMAEGMGWTDDAQKEAKMTDEQRRIKEISKALNVSLTAAAILLQSSDVSILNNRMQQQLQASSKRKKDTKSSSAKRIARPARRTMRRDENR